MPYTGYCDGYQDDGSGYICTCDHVIDEHDDESKCEFCSPGEAP